MITIRSVVFDEQERFVIARVAHLVELAYPRSDTPAHLRPASRSPVDRNDPRLKVLGRLGTEGGLVVSVHIVDLAIEVAVNLLDITTRQATPEFWSRLSGSRHLPVTAAHNNRVMAEAIMATRCAQRDRVAEALDVLHRARGLLDDQDDVLWWKKHRPASDFG